MKIINCECCGHPMVSDKIGVVLTVTQHRVYEVVKRAGSAGITCKEIFDRVYANDPDGGPNSPGIISVCISQANKRLAQFGLKMQGTKGPAGGIRLVRINKVRIK